MVIIYENKLDKDKEGKEEVLTASEKTEPSEKPYSSKLSPYIESFLFSFEKKVKLAKNKDEEKISVSEVFGALARLYERIRTTVEYKGEHVLRRNAIERILRRLIWEQQSIKTDIDEGKIAETLVKELIWASYLPNNSVPQKKLTRIKKIIQKYVYFLKNLDNFPPGVSASKVRLWMWGIASSEIEEVLDPSYRELYVQLMYSWFTNRYEWKDTNLNDHDKEIQIYLSIHRAFTKSDEPIMRYHLLLKEIPNWKRAEPSDINRLILQFPKIYSEIENHLYYKDRFSLYRIIRKHAAAFDILREIVKKKQLSTRYLLENEKKFEKEVRDICDEKYKQIKLRVSTGIVRSIIYIFLTKVFIALIIEIPYEIFIFGDVRYLPLSLNIIIPPSLMWLFGFTIRVPGAKNTEAIVERLKSVVYNQDKVTKQVFSLVKSQKGSFLSLIFGLFYLILFFLVFGTLTYILTLLDFTFFGILIFFGFLSLVILFAFRVRYNANQLKIDSDEEGILGHLTSTLTLPFLNLGFFLSKGLSKLNFFTAILDFLIEIPFKNILEVFEEWTRFLKEKKEEVIEIPE